MRGRRVVLIALTVALVSIGVPAAPSARAAANEQQLRVTMSDGVQLEARLSGAGPIVDGHVPARPTIVELSPYGSAAAIPPVSDDYNYLEVHIRGTGESDGSFDALGDRSQQDVAEVLGWACAQPWTNGHLGLWGFSASAIMAYDAMHLVLPCVDAAVLGAGTHELYRDLMYPGGVPNFAPALYVLGAISAGSLVAGPDRLGRDPVSGLAAFQGLFDSGMSYLQHPSLDAWWLERGMRGTANNFPILLVTGFYDVESRGPFQVFQQLHASQPANHLIVIGAHDGVPAGTGGATHERADWYDHYVRGVDNGVEAHPVVSLWMAHGSREGLLAGDFARADGGDWPIPGTEWRTYYLDATRSGSGSSLNDGVLADAPGPTSTATYPAIPSLPTATDANTIAVVGVFNDPSSVTDMSLAEPLGLGFTTAPFAEPVDAAGPAAVDLRLTSTAPETDILVVLSDVAPDGTAHPVANGRLRTSYPDIDPARSLVDERGDVVQPYGVYASKSPAEVGQEREYHVELWPVGNRFEAGHRLRLHILGASAFSLPTAPALDTIALGGSDGARLFLPVLPAGVVSVPSPTAVAASDAPPVLPVTGGDEPLALIAVAVLVALAARRAHAMSAPR